MPKQMIYTAANLLEYLISLSLETDLTKIPVLYAEVINGKTYISQASESEILLLKDVQDLPDSFEVELNTQSQVGVFIGTFPTID